MSVQEALFDKALARTSDPYTSHEAASSVRDLRDTQREILELLSIYGPGTDEEIMHRLVLHGVLVSPSGARTRRSELVRKGLVVDTGERRLTRANRRTIVWGVARGASW